MIVEGKTETLLRAASGGLIVNPKASLTPEYDAVIVTNVEDETVPALAVNVADVDPCGIVTEDGMSAPVGDELRAMVEPPVGAMPVSATLQVDTAGGAMEMGLHENPFKLGCTMVTVPPLVATETRAAIPSAPTPLVT